MKMRRLGAWLRKLADRVDEKKWDFNEVAMPPNKDPLIEGWVDVLQALNKPLYFDTMPVKDLMLKDDSLKNFARWPADLQGQFISDHPTWPVDKKAPQPLRCVYDIVWTDEVGDIPVCRFHGQNSRHKVTPGLDKDCLELDPYPPKQPEEGCYI